MMETNNRRQKPRIAISFEVEHILSETNHCPCRVEDCGPEGMRITRLEDDRPEAWGNPQHVWLEFKIPGDDGPAIRALGELRHEEGGQRGFYFKYLNPRARRRYDAFLERAQRGEISENPARS